MGATLAERTGIPGNDACAGSVRTHEGPVRLTRRGRIVVTIALLLLIAALSIALASAAQAMRHQAAPAGAATTGEAGLGKYVTKVTVGPGQSLWSIAEAHDPQADTRLVIQEILEMNSLAGDQVQPGEVLWIPLE
jgi:LysM repeat protein